MFLNKCKIKNKYHIFRLEKPNQIGFQINKNIHAASMHTYGRKMVPNSSISCRARWLFPA